MARALVLLGSVFALLAVVLGAFGTHTLEATLTAKHLEIFKTGAYYQMVHALALILIGNWLERSGKSGLGALAGGLIAAGIVIFSGSLYTLALTGVKMWGAVTPVGGLCFILGWTCFTIAVGFPRTKRRTK